MAVYILFSLSVLPLFNDYFLAVVDIHALSRLAHAHATKIIVRRIVIAFGVLYALDSRGRQGEVVLGEDEMELLGLVGTIEFHVGTEVRHGVARLLDLEELALALALAEGIEVVRRVALYRSVLDNAYHLVVGSGVHT
ncbi:MAG: hypothetical protein ACFN0J_06060 [Segatella salivae]